MSDSRPPCYQEGDTLVIRASSLGGPICQLVASGLGNDILPPPPWLQKAFDAGIHWEGPVLAELRRRGWREVSLFGGQLLDRPAAQQEHDWSPVPGIVIRFHPDDILIPVGDDVPATRDRPANFPEGPVLVEAKALSEANYRTATSQGAEKLPYAYDWQLAAMMLGLGLPAVWVTVDKAAALGQAEPTEESILGSLHAQWVPTPPHSKAEIVKRVLHIRKLIAAGTLPTDSAEHNAYPCRFLYLCPKEQEQEAVVHLSGIRGTELARWAQWYEQQKETEKLAKGRAAEAREEIVKLLEGDDRVASDGWVVTRTVGDRAGYTVADKTDVVTVTVRRA